MPPEASSAAATELPRARVRTMLVLWRAVLVVAGWVGRIGHWIFVDARSVTLLAGLVPGALLLAEDRGEAAVIAFAAWLLLVLSLAARTASNRVIIGDFKSATPKTKSEDGPDPPPVDLANLLIVEISRLRDLFRVVADRRAVASGFTHQRALDATLSVDDLVENLQGAVSSDAKTSVGPITIPLAPLVTVFGKLVQAPRLSGNLHVDGPVLILTAQMARRGSLSWRVQRSPEQRENTRDDANDGDDVKAVVSAMVEELALRIYTDLALGRAVRWEASQSFVQGLQRFRACQRTPKDRKVNLKEAEERFLSALAEDEDFPLVYYNLGVVYTELHGLAVDAGRTAEAETRLSAAETSFGRALEKDPSRWESYFAFAQTQFRYSRFDSVVQLCAHIVEQLRPDSGGKAKAHELWARALLGRDRPGDYQKAVKHARQASRLALTSLAKTRLIRRPTPRGEDDPESRCAELAAGCLLTFSDIYSRQMPTARERASGLRGRRRQRLVRRRAQALAALAPAAQGRAQVRYDFGKRLLRGGHLELAKKELAAAVRSEPTRPAYAAELALARARLLAGKNGDVDDAERHEIVGLCLRALQGMAGSFFPSRDEDTCRTVAEVYKCLGNAAQRDQATAVHLERVANAVDERLEKVVGGSSVSSVFLEALQAEGRPLAEKIGDYATAAQNAAVFLKGGKEMFEEGERGLALSRFREALTYAERATSLNPLSTLAWETLGDVHRELSDFQNARIAWSHALSTDPDNPRLYGKIGSSFWNLAYQGRAKPSENDLRQAAEDFEKALLLYESASFGDQVLMHYRLGKLHAGLRDFSEARRHLEIVEAVQPLPPLVGWQLLGFAHLQMRSFSDCEYYFGRVVREGRKLHEDKDEPVQPNELIGDRLDERFWPLALIRAWGHLGLAITAAERDGDRDRARRDIETAEELLAQLDLDPDDPANDERFPTRAPATVAECQGLIHLREGDVDDAVEELERAVSTFPHSRAYIGLALALEERAKRDGTTRKETIARAQELLRHAVSLGPEDEAPADVAAAQQRLARLDTAPAVVAP